MSDSGSAEDRVEKRRISVKDDSVKFKLIETLLRLQLDTSPLAGLGLVFLQKMLELNIELDLSGSEWNDDYNPEDG